jgi:hypothetical protein
MRDDLRDSRADRAQALDVGGLLGQIREQMSEPVARDREKPSVVGDAQEHLRDGERDQLAVADLRRTSGAGARRQREEEVIDAHIKSDDEGVEVGVHAASVVDLAIATPTFGALVMTARSESTV